MEVSFEEFVMIVGEKNKYEKMKQNLRNVNEQQENMRLNKMLVPKKTTSLQIIYVVRLNIC